MRLLIQFLQLEGQLTLESLLVIHALFEVLYRCLATPMGTSIFSTCYFTVVVRPSFSVLKVLVRLMLKSKLLIFLYYIRGISKIIWIGGFHAICGPNAGAIRGIIWLVGIIRSGREGEGKGPRGNCSRILRGLGRIQVLEGVLCGC